MLNRVMALTVCCLFLVQSLPGQYSPAAMAGATAVNPAKWIPYENNPIMSNGTGNAWDNSDITPSCVFFEDGKYWMYYSGYGSPRSNGIGLAFSSDGKSWQKYSGNPIMGPGANDTWDDDYIRNPVVIKDGSIFKMWFEGDGNNEGLAHIGYATSSDGINWTEYSGNPVFSASQPGHWDDSWVDDPWVIKENSEYRMWYFGTNQTTGTHLGFANSTDGINWTRYANNPILSRGPDKAWDAGVTGCSVMNDSTKYRMWYSGSDATHSAIGYATSNDGLSWTKYTQNPVMDTNYSAGEYCPVVIFNGTEYMMWFGGVELGTYEISLAFGRNTAPAVSGLMNPYNNTWAKDDPPWFFWIFSDQNNGDEQTAYQLQVANDSAFTSVIDDTGKVNDSLPGYSPASKYGDGLRYFRIRVWDEDDDCSEWSKTYVTKIDTTAPDNPTTFSSTSHSIGVWSTDSTIDLAFSGAKDAGCGITGYSVLWDYSNSSNPDTSRDLNASDSASTSPAMSDNGSIYFHIRTVDALSHVSGAAHYGPFKIDRTAPVSPTISSPTHAAGSWSNVSTVDVKWSGGGDATSGVRGYSVDWDANTSTIPDGSDEFNSSANGTSSGALSEGDWYFHLRTSDNAGNYATAHFGPVRIDCTSPTNPLTLNSTSHTTGAWSNDSTIDVQISGANDSLSGIDGFSVVWDNSSSTEPGGKKNAANAGSLTSPALADNSSVYFHLRAVDKAGNPSTATMHLGPFKLDSTPPAKPALGSPTHKTTWWSNATTVVVNWTEVDASISGIAGYSVLWDRNLSARPDALIELPACATNCSSPPLDDGTWYLHLGVADNAGNWAFSDIGPFMIDTVNPGNPLDLQSQSHLIRKWSNDSTVDVRWSGAEGGLSGVSGYSIIWDSSPDTIPDCLMECNGATTSLSSPALSDGTSHYFHLRTVDSAGNWNGTAIHLGPFWIDSTPPEPPLNVASSSHAVLKWSNDPFIDIGWSLPGAGADICGYAGFSVAWDSQNNTVPDMTVDISPAATNVTSTKYESAGKVFFHIRAIDNAGNAAETVHIGPFRIDATPPQNPLDLMSDSHFVRVWNPDGTVSVKWSRADASISGIDGYSFAWDNRTDTLPPETVMLTEDAGFAVSPELPSGDSWYFHLRTRDSAGNWAVSAARLGPFWIDTTPPAILSLDINKGSLYTNARSVNITLVSVDGAPGSNVSTMRFRQDGGDWSGWEKVLATKRFVLSGTDGNHSVDAQVRDGVGNLGAVVSRSIMLDSVAPSGIAVDLDDGGGFTNSTTVRVRVFASDRDPGSGGLEYSARQEGSAWSSWCPVGNISILGLTGGDGLKTVQVNVRDAANNVANATPARIFLDTMPPRITSMTLANGTGKSASLSVAVRLNANDTQAGSGLSGYSLACDGTDWGEWLPYSDRTVFNLSAGDGQRTVRCRVRDRALNIAATFSGDVLLDTTPPRILGIRVAELSSTVVAIEWASDEPTKGTVSFGQNGAYDRTGEPTAFQRTHLSVIRDLQPGTAYNARLVGTDLCGNIGEKTLEFATLSSPDRAAPVVTKFTVLRVTDRAALLGWDTDEPAECTVEYGTVKELSSTKQMAGFAMHHALLLSGLQPGTAYRARVRATDLSGNGPSASGVVEMNTLMAADTIPPEISDVSATAVTDSSAVVSWGTDEHSTGFVEAGDASEYRIRVDAGGISKNHAVILKGLRPGTVYHFRVGATDISGNGPAFFAQAVFTTLAAADTTPPAIRDVRVSKVGEKGFTVTVELDEPGPALIEFGNMRDCTISEGTVGIGVEHVLTVTGLEPGTRYRFKVLAWDCSGNGPTASVEKTVVTKPGPAPGMQLGAPLTIALAVLAVAAAAVGGILAAKRRKKA